MKKVTIHDVADRAKVSTATVSIVINNIRPVNEEIRKRVVQAVKELNYTPNYLARGLRIQSTKTIGIVVSDIMNTHLANFVQACEKTAYDNGYSILLCNTEENPEKERRYINVLIKSRVDGLVITPTTGNAELIAKLQENDVPLVLADRYLERLNTNYVGYDNYGAGFLAADHLLSRGYDRPCIVTCLSGHITMQERMSGVRDAFEKRKIAFNPGYAVDLGLHLSRSRFLEIVADKLSGLPAPNGFLSLTNIFANYALTYLAVHNIKCPEEAGVIGIGDIDCYEKGEPFLSVIDVNPRKIGQLAVSMLLAVMQEGTYAHSQRNIFDTKLIVRKSTSGLGKEY